MPDEKNHTAVAAPSPLPEDELGSRVRSIRESLGLTHDGLSNLTKLSDAEGRGISRTTIRGYELGTYKPGAREIRILSLALRKSPSWLLFGETAPSPTDANGTPSSTANSPARWAKLAFPVLAYSQLEQSERAQVVALIETFYRLKIGEVKFRSAKAFIEDISDTIQDSIRDRAQKQELDPAQMKEVLLATVEDVKKRHGDEEAEALLVTMELIFDFWKAGTQ